MRETLDLAPLWKFSSIGGTILRTFAKSSLLDEAAILYVYVNA